ncbi:MAG: hypothetical protein H7839_24905 [Magnetococcus sp. YQC-5]
MVKEIFIKEIANELRAAYEAEGSDDKPSLATLEERYGIPSQVISFAIIQAGGTIRPRGRYRVKKMPDEKPSDHPTLSFD